MNKILALLTLLFALMVLTAHAETFNVSATVPKATSIAITVNKVNSATNQFTPLTGSLLSFDPLTLDPVNGIYLPGHYFAIDINAVNGAGEVQTTLTFEQDATPNTNGHGLGWKSSATMMKVTGSGVNTTDHPLTSHGPKKLLKDLQGEQITPQETEGGWTRIYLGILSKDPNATFPDPGEGEVFSNADKAGTYSGRLIISGTVL